MNAPTIKGLEVKGPEIKGYCPGALRPMQSGDGLLVRVRITAGRLTPHIARGLADIAQAHGNGEIDLSQRANLQIRGATWEALPHVHAGLKALGLLDEDAAGEAVRNVLTSPFAGERGLKLTQELEAAILATPTLHQLPGKFGFAVDDMAGSLGPARADITTRETEHGFIIQLDGADRQLAVSAEHAAPTMLAIAHAFLGLIPTLTTGKRIRHLVDKAQLLAPFGFKAAAAAPAPLVHMPIGETYDHLLGLGLPFGRISAMQLRAMADLAQEIRLTPWRGILLRPNSSAYALEAARNSGLITSHTDPRLKMDACPGMGACSSALQPTRPLGEALAKALLESRSAPLDLHISGCAKGCARRGPADYLLIGTEHGYQLRHNAISIEGKADQMFEVMLTMGDEAIQP